MDCLAVHLARQFLFNALRVVDSLLGSADCFRFRILVRSIRRAMNLLYGMLDAICHH